MQAHQKINNTRLLAHIALFVALEIVLNRFLSINTWNLKIGFSWLPVAIAAALYGPLWGGLTWAMADFIGAILLPIGPYFPGFTFTAFLAGAVYGLFLHRRPVTTVRTAGAVFLAGAINLVLNTVWIMVLYGETVWATLPGRCVQALVLLPIQFILIWSLAAERSPVGRAIMRAAA